MVWPRNKPINNVNPYNLPIWLFRDKTTTHIDPHKKKRSSGIFYNTKRYKRVNLYVFKSSISCRIINPSTQNKLHFQSKCMWEDQVIIKKTSICILEIRHNITKYICYVWWMQCSPSKVYSPSMCYLPNVHNCNTNLQLPLPYPTPPFCHDIGKEVVPNRVTQGKER